MKEGVDMRFNKYLKDKFGVNEPIYIEDISFEDYSKSWIFTELKKLVDNGELKRFDRGVYYFPEIMSWGESIPNTNKIIERKFISDGNEIYGYITGLSLWNQTGLSAQVPFLTEIATNKESARVRDISVGYRRVRVRKSRAVITKENVSTLQLLDLMNVMQSPSKFDETEVYLLEEFVKQSKEAGVTKESLSKYSPLFPAKATNNLVESGVIYEFA